MAKSADYIDKVNKEIEEVVEEIAWFSYRKNWSPPIINNELTNDIGWGCMIRSGQMLLYHLIVRDNNWRLSLADKKKILLYFNDFQANSDSPFSIQNIVPLANEEFDIVPGSWFRSTSILMTLEKLCESYSYSCEHVRNYAFITFVDSVVIHETLKNKLNSPGFQDEEDAFTDILSGKKSYPWGTSQKKLIVSIASRLGLDKPEPKFKEFLIDVLKLPQFCGMLGGKGNRAYFIFGYCEENDVFYYLDPHLVQDAVTPDDFSIDTYFQKTIYEYQYEDMNSNIQLSFIVKNENDLNMFWESITRINKMYPETDRLFITYEKDEDLITEDQISDYEF